MKKCIFVGNRYQVFESLLNDFEGQLDTVLILVEKNSLLQSFCEKKGIDHTPYSNANKAKVIRLIEDANFDFLISNGLGFILPVTSLKKNHQLFLNVHPTYLPYLKGRTPINGVFLNGLDFFGATLHIMNDKVDEGEIVYQKREQLTEDIDLPLLYYMSFRLERIVFQKGMKSILNKTALPYSPSEAGSVFNRKEEFQIIDKLCCKDILLKVKAFGIKSQGCQIATSKGTIIVFKCSEVSNKLFLSWFSSSRAGDILLDIDDFLYLKTLDGVIKIERFKWL